uniref:Uncharacterized protein n=1 Tax=Romanomermis culicivorax TaxID=13658 RepID=A0A915L0R9_ROMCU
MIDRFGVYFYTPQPRGDIAILAKQVRDCLAIATRPNYRLLINVYFCRIYVKDCYTMLLLKSDSRTVEAECLFTRRAVMTEFRTQRASGQAVVATNFQSLLVTPEA